MHVGLLRVRPLCLVLSAGWQHATDGKTRRITMPEHGFSETSGDCGGKAEIGLANAVVGGEFVGRA